MGRVFFKHKLNERSQQKYNRNNTLMELNLSSDEFRSLYDKSDRKRRDSLSTRVYARKSTQMGRFQSEYIDSFNKEHRGDTPSVDATMEKLRFTDKSYDGSNVYYFINNSGVSLSDSYNGGKGHGFYWNELRDSDWAQTIICRMSPKNALMTAKWCKQNNIGGNVRNIDIIYNPEFWSQYYGDDIANESSTSKRVFFRTNRINEYNYVSRQGCIFDECDLEERYGYIEKELQRLGINATIEYPYCTDEKVTISIDSLARKTAVDLCLQDNEYKFESMNRRGNKIFLTYTYDWDNSIFAL